MIVADDLGSDDVRVRRGDWKLLQPSTLLPFELYNRRENLELAAGVDSRRSSMRKRADCRRAHARKRRTASRLLLRARLDD